MTPAGEHPAGRRAWIMGLATLIGAAACALPYAVLGRAPATAVAAAIGVVLLVVIAEVRHRTKVAGLGSVAVFGGFDGLTSEVAVLAGQLVHTAGGARSIAVVGCALAAGSAVSMGFGEWLEDREGISRPLALAQTFATAAAAIAAGVLVSLLFGAGG